MKRDEMLKFLKGMLVAELDDLVDALRIPIEYLTFPAAPTSRAIEVIRYLESKGRLTELERYLQRIEDSEVTHQHISTENPKTTAAIGLGETHSQHIKKQSVFLCYAHKDAKWLNRLKVHLTPLTREQLLEAWDDTRIRPGMDWKKEIEQALDRASMAVLLVSADFLASDFIANNELPFLLESASKRGIHILSLIIAPSLFLEHPIISKIQTVNPPKNPLNGMKKNEAEAALVALAKVILEYIQGP